MEEKAIKAKYTKILKYEIEAEAESSLHIGNGMSDEGEVLVDDRTGEPFIQGTSVAGAFLEAADEEQKNILEIEMSRRVLLTIKAELRFLMYILRIMLV